jgi:ATP phosphoribosyltransferase regulatory subunit
MGIRQTISLPQGVRDILPHEAERIRVVEESILKVFKGHGFSRVIPPILEFVEVLSLGMGRGLKEKVLKFVDPSTGRIMAIRPDITPQIARVVATRLKDNPLPIKLCYNESVLRCLDNGKNIEVLQAGAELVTKGASPQADAEMIVMAMEALISAGVRGFKIDIGDVGFLKAILEGLKVPDRDKRLLRQSIAIKDMTALKERVAGLGRAVSKGDRSMLLSLATLYGEADILERASGSISSRPAARSLEYLKKVIHIIRKKGLIEHITIDLAELRGSDYYTGIIFEGFAPGIGKPILSGGRYDTLVERYGYRAAATGFAFDIGNIADALQGPR